VVGTPVIRKRIDFKSGPRADLMKGVKSDLLSLLPLDDLL
jgi:hypothetical protein